MLLIDEADIYMEHRSVQDIARNSLVAGFLRALEYFKGVLFLTTNRVGHFDEAFISRINITIYYSPFNEDQRRELWESYFRKLQKEREDKMRIHIGTRDYVAESNDLRKMDWNGREIKNGKFTEKLLCLVYEGHHIDIMKPSRSPWLLRRQKVIRMKWDG